MIPIVRTIKQTEIASRDKTVLELVKFLLVSGAAGIIQIVLANVLYYAMRGWTTPLPEGLARIFSEETMGQGNSCWGAVLPFFLSNLLANVYAYAQNRRTTFHSDAPAWCFWVYLVVLSMLILFSTWLQGAVVNLISGLSSDFLNTLAPTIAAACAGFVQFLVLFPLEKFVLFRKRSTECR